MGDPQVLSEHKQYEVNQSAQPCGCDPGANHECDWHRVFGYPEPLLRQSRQEQPYRWKPITPADIACIRRTAMAEYPDDPLVIRTRSYCTEVQSPARATTLPTSSAERKQYPVGTGVLDYFPDALVAIAKVSYLGNEQHNPGQPLHWAREKSADQADTMIRHYLERGTIDNDGGRHTAKMAWRALAILQLEIEAERQQLSTSVNNTTQLSVVDNTPDGRYRS